MRPEVLPLVLVPTLAEMLPGPERPESLTLPEIGCECTGSEPDESLPEGEDGHPPRAPLEGALGPAPGADPEPEPEAGPAAGLCPVCWGTPKLCCGPEPCWGPPWERHAPGGCPGEFGPVPGE